jgi:hypothetical protein
VVVVVMLLLLHDLWGLPHRCHVHLQRQRPRRCVALHIVPDFLGVTYAWHLDAHLLDVGYEEATALWAVRHGQWLVQRPFGHAAVVAVV